MNSGIIPDGPAEFKGRAIGGFTAAGPVASARARAHPELTPQIGKAFSNAARGNARKAREHHLDRGLRGPVDVEDDGRVVHVVRGAKLPVAGLNLVQIAQPKAIVDIASPPSETTLEMLLKDAACNIEQRAEAAPIQVRGELPFASFTLCSDCGKQVAVRRFDGGHASNQDSQFQAATLANKLTHVKAASGISLRLGEGTQVRTFEIVSEAPMER